MLFVVEITNEQTNTLTHYDIRTSEDFIVWEPKLGHCLNCLFKIDSHYLKRKLFRFGHSSSGLQAALRLLLTGVDITYP